MRKNTHLSDGPFYLKNRHFCPRSARETKKGTKKYVPRVPGTQTRDKIDFLRFAYINRKAIIFTCYSTC